ncbi:MAG: hypothetical protein JSR58_01455 [Verrucomicrobia bacterium]|nr:hypothetical protein [Verrucomicrobiota bacterium]
MAIPNSFAVGTWNISCTPADYSGTVTYAFKGRTNPFEDQNPEDIQWNAELKAVEQLRKNTLPAIFALQEVGVRLADGKVGQLDKETYGGKSGDRPIVHFLKEQGYSFCGILDNPALSTGSSLQTSCDTATAVSKKVFKDIRDISFKIKTKNPADIKVDAEGDQSIAAFSAIHKETGEQVIGINVHLPSLDYLTISQEVFQNTPSTLGSEMAGVGNGMIKCITDHIPQLCQSLKGRVHVIVMGDFNATYLTPIAQARMEHLRKEGFDLVGWALDEAPSQCNVKSNSMVSPDFIFLNTVDNRGRSKTAFDKIKSIFLSCFLDAKGPSSERKPKTSNPKEFEPSEQDKCQKLQYFPKLSDQNWNKNVHWDLTSNPSDHIPVFSQIKLEKQSSLLWRALAYVGSWVFFWRK